MASDKPCPICGFHLVSDEVAECPQCDADLTCFRVLDAIPDEAVSVSEDGGRRTEDRGQTIEVRRPSSVFRYPFLCAGFLLLFGLGAGLFLSQTHQSKSPPPVVLHALPMGIKVPVKTIVNYGVMDSSAFAEFGFSFENDPKKEAGSSDFKDTSDGIAKTEIFTDYEASGDETLWRISKKCYGRGFYFPVLMELNPGLGVYNLEKGRRLKIFRDAAEAKHLYHRIIRIAGKKVWYGYRVVASDSLEGIAMKFYGPEGTTKRIRDVNPHITLKPGERIEVELE